MAVDVDVDVDVLLDVSSTSGSDTTSMITSSHRQNVSARPCMCLVGARATSDGWMARNAARVADRDDVRITR